MNSKTRIGTIILLLTIMFSFSVLAEVPTPGESITNLFQFIKDLFAGVPEIESAYLISQILFFILFLAIFMEGLRALPIFGYKGEVNKQGKVFSVAASLLSTLSLYVIDYATQVSTTERLNALLAPFGVWGGLAIAGIMCYITFKLIYDSEVFREQVMLAIAIAASVGITFAGFLLSLNNLIGWGYLIMLLALLVGAIVAFAKWKKDGGTFGIGGNGSTPGGGTSDENTRPPGREPPPSPRKANPDDPPMPPGKPKPGENPNAPTVPAPKVPKQPKIPDEEKIFVDLSPDFMGIRSQDGLGACTAFAATSIFEYIRKVGYKQPEKYLSPTYLYYQTRKKYGEENRDVGAASSLAIDTLTKDGVCFEDLWTFEGLPSNKFRTAPDAAATNDAVTKKLIDFRRLDRRDPDQWVHELRNKNPCYISVDFPNDMNLPYNKAFYENSNPGKDGGHGMVIVGYHSHYPYKGKGVKSFKIRNSHGINWGKNGYTWVPANTLVKMVRTGVWVLKGWQKDTPKKDLQKFKITGRVVFDPDRELDLKDMTGKQIYNAKLDGFVKGHKFFVGVLAQIKGNLVPLSKPIMIDTTKDTSGKFELKFEADPNQFEKIKHKIDGVNLKKQPAGVVVYKGSEGEREIYYHITNFKHSFAGRGGEGTTHSDNPRSDLVKGNKKLKFSGRPIQFSKNHNHEENVIIPIYDPPKKNTQKIIDEDKKKKLAKTLEKIKKYATKEKKWLATEFNYLEKLKEDVETQLKIKDLGQRNTGAIRNHSENVGRSEKNVEKFEQRLEKELKELVKEIVSIKGVNIYYNAAEKIQRDMKTFTANILKYNSRYEGSIRKLLENIEEVTKIYTDLFMSKKTHWREEKELNEKWPQLLEAVNKIIGWTNGLQVEIKNLEELEEHIKKNPKRYQEK